MPEYFEVYGLESLNPFYCRGVFESTRTANNGKTFFVLIPFIAGVFLNAGVGGKKVGGGVLIPFIAGVFLNKFARSLKNRCVES